MTRARWRALVVLVIGTASLAATATTASAHEHPSALAPHASSPRATKYWSGYVVGTRGHAAYTSVSATWTEPRATCYGGNPDPQLAATIRSAIWVGLGGWDGSGLEQTGSNISCDGTRASYGVWFELVLGAHNPMNAFEQYRVPVAPGDHLSASVTSSATGSYVLTITDATKRWRMTRHADHLAGASNSTAEVIFEQHGGFPAIGRVAVGSARVDRAPIATLHPLELYAANLRRAPDDSVSPITGGDAFIFTVPPPSTTIPASLVTCLERAGYVVRLLVASRAGTVGEPIEPVTPAVTAYVRAGDAADPDLADVVIYDTPVAARAADRPITRAGPDVGRTPRVTNSTLYAGTITLESAIQLCA